MNKLDLIRKKMKDERSGEVIFVSHCILNTNARYLGGAFRPGTVEEIIRQAMETGVGIVQMECPEQLVWGGVLKPFLWLASGSGKKTAYLLKSMLLPFFIFYTRMRYKRIAVSTARKITDYIRSGFTVKAIIGIDGSPSCGVSERLSMRKSFALLAGTALDDLTRTNLNQALYERCLEPGSGIFIQELKRQLSKRKVRIEFDAHNLTLEKDGKASAVRLAGSNRE